MTTHLIPNIEHTFCPQLRVRIQLLNKDSPLLVL